MDPGDADPPGQVEGSTPGKGYLTEPHQIAAVMRAAEERRAKQKEEPLEEDEQQLLDRLDAHDPEFATTVMDDDGNMVPEDWPREWK